MFIDVVLVYFEVDDLFYEVVFYVVDIYVKDVCDCVIWFVMKEVLLIIDVSI